MPVFQKLSGFPCYDRRSSRDRCFHPKLISDGKSLSQLTEQLSVIKINPTTSRISVRAIVKPTLLSELSDDFKVEAKIPIDNFFEGYILAYLAWNRPGRVIDHELAAAQIREVASLIPSARPIEIDKAQTQTKGYRIIEHPLVGSTIDPRTAENIADLFSDRFALYPMKTEPEDIQRMLENHFVLTAHDAHTDALVAVFMAECTTVTVETKQLSFAEFNHVLGKNGVPHELIPLMAFRIIQQATEHNQPLIFAEARADILALQAACLAVGMEHAGIMEVSFLMQDRIEASSGYKNAHVWYLPRDTHE